MEDKLIDFSTAKLAKEEGNKKFPVHYCYNIIKVEEI